MSRQSKQVTVTRQKLVEAFWQLFETNRVDQIRVKQITDLAGYHRGTFYEYFKDVHDVLRQEEDAIIEQIISSRRGLDLGEMSDDILQQVVDIYETHGKKLSLLLGIDGDPQFIYRLKKVMYPTFRETTALPDSAETALVFEFAVSGMIMAFQNWYTSKNRLPTEQFIQLVYSLATNGVLRTINNQA